jgi:hypothetical protein
LSRKTFKKANIPPRVANIEPVQQIKIHLIMSALDSAILVSSLPSNLAISSLVARVLRFVSCSPGSWYLQNSLKLPLLDPQNP